MGRKIEQVHFVRPAVPTLKNVAAYARVSTGKDAMLHSLSAQVSYYSELIQQEPGWRFCGVYADEALTGTRDNREEFQRLLDACRAGQVDMIITKSISRFSRNTITLLETVRELKQLGVDVYFEEQNIHSASADGELMLTILASYAQEESLSSSDNLKWQIKNKFENGMPWNGTMLGYRLRQGVLTIQPEEAVVVRQIFDDYQKGLGLTAIAKKLNVQGVPTRFGNQWCKNGVMRILRNYTYTGNLLLQTTFRDDHLHKRKCQNNGELPMYHITDCHEAIVSVEEFEAVQNEIKRRAEKHAHRYTPPNSYIFSGMLVCSGCGKHYRRKPTSTGIKWNCPTYNTMGKAACDAKRIPEETLMNAAADALGLEQFDSEIFLDQISVVKVEKANRLLFIFKDGRERMIHWQDRSRSESWTWEMRDAARRRAEERSDAYA